MFDDMILLRYLVEKGACIHNYIILIFTYYLRHLIGKQRKKTLISGEL